MLKAAGIMLTASSGKVLLMRRGHDGDMPGTWEFPGGKIEDGETAVQAAVREALEETGQEIVPPSVTLLRSTMTGVDYTTFSQTVDDEFAPVLSDEHLASIWIKPDDALNRLTPVHPGVVVALQKLDMDELGVARAMSIGSIASPSRYENMLLVAMRITGTGISYRAALNEFVYRRPENYLSDDFLARCNGLPVIMMHPEKAVLDSEEFADRVVGTMMLPYVQGDEVWGIAKVYDAETIDMLETRQMSTSPAVVFRDLTVNSKMILEDGSTLLIEGKPSLLDHLAICENGVWDKGEEPNGIRNDSNDNGVIKMSDIEHAIETVADKRKDTAEGGNIDKVLAHLDSMNKRFDSLDARIKNFEKPHKADSEKETEEEEDKKDHDKKDHEKKDAKSKRHDQNEHSADEPGIPEKVAADKAKKDAEEKCEKEEKEEKAKKDADEKDERAKADSADLRRRIDELSAKMPKPMSDSARAEMADAQAKADSVFHVFGDSAPRPLDGETISGYRRRVASKLKVHSANWKDVNLSAITDDTAFAPIERMIYADAVQAANHPLDLGEGELREIARTDRSTGQRIVEFKGRSTFIKAMTPPVRRVRSINQARGA